LRYAVERAALLEATGHLQVFQLEVYLLPGEGGEHLGVRAGGVVDGGADVLAGGEDVGELDGEGGGNHLAFDGIAGKVAAIADERRVMQGAYKIVVRVVERGNVSQQQSEIWVVRKA
jgi:hypothetical protein